MDKYQKFGLFTLILSLFFLIVIHGMERILFIGSTIYSLVFLFHTPLEQILIPRVRNPLSGYVFSILFCGLFIEVLAYLSNTMQIQSGEKAFLFTTDSLFLDLVMSLPYYGSFAFIFMWILKRYEFSTSQFGFVLWLGQAISVDEFSHLFSLLHGDIIGFIVAGFLMLFPLHTPLILFENTLREAYPERSHSKVKYPILLVSQLVPLATIFMVALLVFNFFH